VVSSVKAKEMREMTIDELEKYLSDLRQELFNLRFQLAVGQLENTSRIRVVKREIARVLTVLNEKKAEEAPK